MNRELRICAAVWFFICGSTLAMFLGLAAPSNVYLYSAILLACASLPWLRFPQIAACISLPVLGALTYMLYRYPFGSFGVMYGLAFVACYVLIGLAFRARPNGDSEPPSRGKDGPPVSYL